MSFDLHTPPKAGHRISLPTLDGSADAYALSLTATTLKNQQRMLTIFVADAADAQRLKSDRHAMSGDALYSA